MAKKAPVKAPLEEAKKPAPEKSTLPKAKTAVVHAAEKVADVVSQVAGAAKSHVVTPVAEAVGIVKKKKSRPARAKKLPPTTPVPLPPRSTTAAGKMMSKNLSLPPKEKPTRGAKAKSKSKP